MVLNNLFGCEREPLRRADIGKLGSLQHLQKDDVLIARVFNIVACRHWNVPNAAGREVKSACGLGCLEHCDACRALKKVVPFRRRRVPVDLTHGAGLNSHERSGKVGRQGKGSRVNDLDRATRNFIRLLLRPVKGLRLKRPRVRAGRRSQIPCVVDLFGLRCAVKDLARSGR